MEFVHQLNVDILFMYDSVVYHPFICYVLDNMSVGVTASTSLCFEDTLRLFISSLYYMTKYKCEFSFPHCIT